MFTGISPCFATTARAAWRKAPRALKGCIRTRRTSAGDPCASLIGMSTADTPLLFDKDKQYPSGHCFLPPNDPRLLKLAKDLWGFTQLEVRQASTWLPSALVAASPNLDQIIAAVDAAPLKAWVAQLGTVDWTSIHSAPVLDRSIEKAILQLIDSLDSLLRPGLIAAVPWLRGERLLERLIFACTQTLLQRGREVVCGLAAYVLGRDDCNVLCNMSSDCPLYDRVGVPHTLFSLINLLSPQYGTWFGVGTQLFSVRPDTNHKLRANPFLEQHYELDTCELTALVPPRCPNSEAAPHLLSTQYPNSIALRVLQVRFGFAVASCATHHTHSNSGPSHQLELAELTGHVVSDVRGGEEVKKEQSIPCVLDHPVAGSILCFCPASTIEIDMRTLYFVTLDGLDYTLSPAGRNLSLLLAQPAAANTGARDQAYLLAQVISRVCGDLCCHMAGDTQLLSRPQRKRKNEISEDFYRQFEDTLETDF